ncbi:50S ribosomal protein L4 [Hoyosella rhizosphaerae]|nr:50S ribosomal protein L4 [Hoyosella rhizosphaerae]MBN4925234.1 50S ribosomal protein L4 [Hoyosella rhizosphaerae]
MTSATNATTTKLTLDVRGPDGATAGTVDLPAELFDARINKALMHQVVVAQLAAARQGTHSTKTRAEVSGGGRKPYRQKGTGRARQGSTRAPQFVGGGTVHGPKPRDYSQRTPKKMIAGALRSALSDRAQNERIQVITELVPGQKPSTKAAQSFLGQLSERRNLLLVVGREDITAWQSVNNLDNVHPIAPDQLNTYDVLYSDDVIFTVEALNTFIASRTGAATAGEESK